MNQLVIYLLLGSKIYSWLSHEYNDRSYLLPLTKGICSLSSLDLERARSSILQLLSTRQLKSFDTFHHPGAFERRHTLNDSQHQFAIMIVSNDEFRDRGKEWLLALHNLDVCSTIFNRSIVSFSSVVLRDLYLVPLEHTSRLCKARSHLPRSATTLWEP
jgi:hypothetical protein